MSKAADVKTTEQPPIPTPAIPSAQGPVLAYEEFRSKPKKWYWLGTLPGSPKQNIDTSHCSFPGFVADRQTDITTGRIRMIERMGRIAQFTDEEVEQIKKELGYEFIAVTAAKPIVIEDEMGVRKNFNHQVGKAWTHKDVNGASNPFHKSEPWMEGSKPYAAFVYMIPLEATDAAKAKASWPMLEDFVNTEKIVEGEGLVWANLDQFKVDRLPQPVGRPAEGAKKTA